MMFKVISTTAPSHIGAGPAGCDETGLSGVAGLVAIAASMVLVLLLALFSAGTFSSSSSNGGSSVLSSSRSEQQLQLCVEGRPSIYGNPPSQAQQAACTRQLAGQLGGVPGETSPLPGPSTTSPTFGYPAG